MRYPSPLAEGVLLGRRKRFFADVRLDDGSEVVAHCVNSGSLRGVIEPGQRVRISRAANPDRMLKWTWEQARVGRRWVGVNTSIPNRAVEEALRAGRLAVAEGRREVRREVVYGRERSRVDFVVEGAGLPPLALEVKNVSMAEDGRALFPDSVTERGRKHLRELAAEVRAGRAAAVLFFVHRGDCASMGPADAVDPAYGRALRWAARQGVRLVAHRADLDRRGVVVGEEIPVVLDRGQSPGRKSRGQSPVPSPKRLDGRARGR